ncbi:MAG TPA: hypothetical protein VHY08_25850 [Bacillota bacterium]|nr:hypothetical protein [Bacillota bacterium]
MKPSNVSFKELNKLLRQLGFILAPEASTTYLVYTHGISHDLIILPKYRPSDKVREVHLTAIKKSLSENGIISGANFDAALLDAQKTRNIRTPNGIAISVAASKQFSSRHRSKTSRKSPLKPRTVSDLLLDEQRKENLRAPFATASKQFGARHRSKLLRKSLLTRFKKMFSGQ